MSSGRHLSKAVERRQVLSIALKHLTPGMAGEPACFNAMPSGRDRVRSWSSITIIFHAR